MKKRWNTRRLVPVSLLLGLLLICGTVFAYMFMRTDPIGVQFVPAEVSCEVYSPGNSGEVTEVTVKNTGNIKEYLRVRLVTYWVDGDNNVAAKPSPTLTVSYNDTWIAGSENTFYYKYPVNPDAVTQESLLKDPIVLKTEDGFRQVVDIFGEAIQAAPVDAAVDSWHVTVSGTTITGAS